MGCCLWVFVVCLNDDGVLGLVCLNVSIVDWQFVWFDDVILDGQVFFELKVQVVVVGGQFDVECLFLIVGVSGLEGIGIGWQFVQFEFIFGVG